VPLKSRSSLLVVAVLLVASAAAVFVASGGARASTSSTPLPLQEFISDHAGSRVWNTYDQSVGANGPAYYGQASALLSPSGVAYVFVQGSNGDLYAYESNHANGQTWNAYDLTAIAGGSPKVGAPPDAVYDPTSGLIHVYVQGANTHLYEFVDDDLGGRLWNAYDHSLDAGGGGTITGTPSAVYVTSQTLMHVYVESGNGHLVEYLADHVGGHVWNAYDHTVDAGGSSSIGASPGAIYDTFDGLVHVYVAATSGNLMEYLPDHLGGHVWNAYDHTVDAGGGVTIAGAPDPILVGSLMHVYVDSGASHLVEYLPDHVGNHVWDAYDHTLDAGGGVTIAGVPSTVIPAGQSTPHVFVRSFANDLVEFVPDHAGSHVWNTYDHTLDGGGTTVGSDPSTIGTSNGEIHVYVGGPLAPGGPPRTGVGVYGFASWSAASQAITDGWGILGDTGGLGTLGPPYTAELSAKPDRNIGTAITSTRTRVTWLSFWTVSGPAQGQANCGGTAPTTNDTWYSAAYQAGQAAATALDQDFLASGAKPDYVILDPEGCNYGGGGPPDQTSWDQFLQGWAAGVTSVDGSLNPGFYANQGEYYSENLASIGMPAFVAVSPIICNYAGASNCSGAANTPNRPFSTAEGLGSPGNNITGYIEYGDFGANPPQPNCPAAPYESAILNWGAPYNTLQFPDSGVDCGP